MKKPSQILALSLLSTVLAGCSWIRLVPPQVDWDNQWGSEVPAIIPCDDRQELNFYHLFPRGDAGFATIARIINAFNSSDEASDAGVCIKGNGVNFWDYWSRVDNALSTNTAPDIFLHQLDESSFRAKNNQLLNLSAMLEQDLVEAIPTFDFAEDFYPSQLQTATFEDDIYALPWSTTVRVVYYNKNLWNAAGLTEEDIPTTWDELKNISGLLTTFNQDGAMVHLGMDPYSGEGQHIQQWIWSGGYNPWISQGDGKFTPNFNRPEIAELMNYIDSFPGRVDRSKLQQFFSQFQVTGMDPFVSGKVGMQISTEGLYTTLRQANVDFDYGVFTLPKGPNNQGNPVNWSSSFSIELFDNTNRNNLTPQVANLRNRGSWLFLKYLFSLEVQAQFYSIAPFLLSHRGHLATLINDDEILLGLSESIQYSREKEYVPFAPKWHSDFFQEMGGFFIIDPNTRRPATEVLLRMQNLMIQKKTQ
ncbi:MAG: extracellular solute-binding protein, partial [Firmicutes bacterium]|nr:extracellular solute-binding protein [Bacillota bacterium]